MVHAAPIDRQAVYDDGALFLELGLSARTLTTARREGRLKHTKLGHRVLYLGSWVLEWLEAEGRRVPMEAPRD